MYFQAHWTTNGLQGERLRTTLRIGRLVAVGLPQSFLL